MKIGYLGPNGSYSSEVAKNLFARETLIEYNNFYSVFNSLKNDQTDIIVVPIENSLQGYVTQNLQLLQTFEGFYAVDSYLLKIEHKLIFKEGSSISKINRVFSHEQALLQCGRFLAESLPNAKIVITDSTAKSVEKIESDSDAGIVSSRFNKKGFVLSNEIISDEKQNFTKFLVVKKGENFKDKTDTVFVSVTCPHEAGSLYSTLKVFKTFGLNMTKIQSQPVKERLGEYRFFIEFDGDIFSENVKNAIKKLKDYCEEFKLLGAY